MLRRILVLLAPCLLALVATAAGALQGSAAQEGPQRVPPERVKPLAMRLTDGLKARTEKPPVAVTPNLDQAIGYQVGQDAGMILIADKGLTAAAIDGAGEEPVPVAVGFTRAATVFDEKGAILGERRATMPVGVVQVALWFMAVRKKGGQPVLEVYSKDRTALVTVPLKKSEGAAAPALAVAFERLDAEKNQADLVLTLPGTQRATLRVGLE